MNVLSTAEKIKDDDSEVGFSYNVGMLFLSLAIDSCTRERYDIPTSKFQNKWDQD